MSEHYPMQLTIGGRITKETFGIFCNLFREAAYPRNPIPPLDEYLDENGSFYHEDDDCTPAGFDELLELCRLRGLSFLRRGFGPDHARRSANQFAGGRRGRNRCQSPAHHAQAFDRSR